MNQGTAPTGTVATIGHPANHILVVKDAEGWRRVDSGDLVDPEDFRAGWDLAEPHVEDFPLLQERYREHLARERDLRARLTALQDATVAWQLVALTPYWELLDAAARTTQPATPRGRRAGRQRPVYWAGGSYGEQEHR